MKIIAIVLSLFATSVFAQTIEEQIKPHAEAINAICETAGPPCYVIVKVVPAVCPDPLVGTRAQLTEASTNLTKAAQAVDQVLLDNP